VPKTGVTSSCGYDVGSWVRGFVGFDRYGVERVPKTGETSVTSLPCDKFAEDTSHLSSASHTAQEASCRRVVDPYAPLLLNLYHYLEQNLHFG